MKTFLLSAILLMTSIFAAQAFETTSLDPVITAPAPMSNWDKLGQKNVNYLIEKDVINVGIVEGLFTAVKLRITGNDINLHRLVIKFKNGPQQQVMIKKNIPAGGYSREIQLNGSGRRIIKEVVMFYERETAAQPARVEVWGKHN